MVPARPPRDRRRRSGGAPSSRAPTTEAVDRARRAGRTRTCSVVQDTGDGDVAGLGHRRLRHDRRPRIDVRGPTSWPCRSASAQFAAAGWCGRFRRQRGIIGVEPASAAVPRSPRSRAGAPVEVPGPHESVMAGLNCGNRRTGGGGPVVQPRQIEAFRRRIDGRPPAPRGRAPARRRRDHRRREAARPASSAGLLAFGGELDLPPTVLVVNTEGATAVLGPGSGSCCRPTGRRPGSPCSRPLRRCSGVPWWPGAVGG